MSAPATQRQCTVDGCGRPIKGRGLCNMHYLRERRNGDPLIVRADRGDPVNCSVTDCRNVAAKGRRGWCHAHYRRWRISGDVQADVPLVPHHDIGNQLMPNISKDAETGHWYWTGYTCSVTGYGKVQIGGKTTGAHRAVYEYLVGPIPAGHEPDHVCRVRTCVNVLDPDHIEVVTQAENARRASRNRGVAVVR